MKGNGRQMLEGAWDVVEQSLTDPLFWAERMLPGLFFLVLGGLLGSFLNVVAYRVPRGGSVSGRRSHCPACGTMIRGRDNVPVLAWPLSGVKSFATASPAVPTRRAAPSGGDSDALQSLAEDISLWQHLRGQIGAMRLSPELADMASLVADELEDDGYLRAPLEEVARRHRLSARDAIRAMRAPRTCRGCAAGTTRSSRNRPATTG